MVHLGWSCNRLLCGDSSHSTNSRKVIIGFRRKKRRNLQGRPAGCSRWQLRGEGKYDGSHNGQPEPLRQQHLGPHTCIYSHTLLRISFRSTVKLSSCYKQSFISSLHTVWDLTRASCCVVEGGEKNWKESKSFKEGKLKRREPETDKSLPQATLCHVCDILWADAFNITQCWVWILTYDFTCMSEIDARHIPKQVGIRLWFLYTKFTTFPKLKTFPVHQVYVVTMYTADELFKLSYKLK